MCLILSLCEKKVHVAKKSNYNTKNNSRMSLLTKGEQWWDRVHWVFCAPSGKWWVQLSVLSFLVPFHQLKFHSNCYYRVKPSIPVPGAEMKNSSSYLTPTQIINTSTTETEPRFWCPCLLRCWISFSNTICMGTSFPTKNPKQNKTQNRTEVSFW